MMDGCTYLGFKSRPPFAAIIMHGRARIFFNITDYMHLKEEIHIHIGCLEGE